VTWADWNDELLALEFAGAAGIRLIEAARKRSIPDATANAVEIVAPVGFDKGLTLDQKMRAAKWRAAKALGLDIDKPRLPAP
jgi:hypothetical protein